MRKRILTAMAFAMAVVLVAPACKKDDEKGKTEQLGAKGQNGKTDMDKPEEGKSGTESQKPGGEQHDPKTPEQKPLKMYTPEEAAQVADEIEKIIYTPKPGKPRGIDSGLAFDALVAPLNDPPKPDGGEADLKAIREKVVELQGKVDRMPEGTAKKPSLTQKLDIMMKYIDYSVVRAQLTPKHKEMIAPLQKIREDYKLKPEISSQINGYKGGYGTSKNAELKMAHDSLKKVLEKYNAIQNRIVHGYPYGLGYLKVMEQKTEVEAIVAKVKEVKALVEKAESNDDPYTILSGSAEQLFHSIEGLGKMLELVEQKGEVIELEKKLREATKQSERYYGPLKQISHGQPITPF